MGTMFLQKENPAKNNLYAMDLAALYAANVLEIATCESSEGWTNNGWTGITGTYSVNNTNFKTGDSSAQCVTNTTEHSGIHLVKSMNMTLFSGGGASTTDDMVTFIIYIVTAEITKLSTGLKICFMNEAYLTRTVGFYYQVSKASLVNGYNYISAKKSDFLMFSPGADWATITGVSIEVDGAASSACTYSIDTVMMYKYDSTNLRFNPIYGNGFPRQTSHWFLGYESGVLNLRELRGTVNSGVLRVDSAVSSDADFVMVCQMQLMTAASSIAGTRTTIDSNNLVRLLPRNSTTLMQSFISGSPTSTFFPRVVYTAGDVITVKIMRYGIRVVVGIQLNSGSWVMASFSWKTGAISYVDFDIDVSNGTYNIKSLEIYNPETLDIDMSFIDVNMPEFSRDFGKIDQFRDGSYMYGFGHGRSGYLALNRKFAKSTSGTALTTARDSILKWITGNQANKLYWYRWTSGNAMLHKTEIVPVSKTAEKFSNYAITQELELQFSVINAFLEDIAVKNTAITVTGTTTNSGTITVAGIGQVYPKFYFLVTTAATVFQVIDGNGNGFRFEWTFAAGSVLLFDCATGIFSINDVPLYGAMVFGSILPLQPGVNTLYINANTGFLYVNYSDRYL